MLNFLLHIIFFTFFLFFEFFYFRVAIAKNIIDNPNNRSSHISPTIRGGGIVFPVAVICWAIFNQFQYPFFLLGLILISSISFLDDIKNLHNRIRFIIHIVAVSMLLYQMSLPIGWYWYLPMFILIVGFINAYNFMDGINGMTGSYSLTTLGSLWYLNHHIVSFTSEDLIVFVILSTLVFNFFNFRFRAKCFAGDVGSISIAFIIAFIIMQATSHINSGILICFLLIYGLDSVTTIIFRLIRKENIFEAHRSHFYQFLSNERKWPHLLVSSVYSIAQLIVNAIIILVIQNSSSNANIALWYWYALVAGLFFIALRFLIEGSVRLLGDKRNNLCAAVLQRTDDLNI
jgi:UDP-GlcNAc:undecaprenyl-phosphate GlcNAc-1-phosphate transferase